MGWWKMNRNMKSILKLFLALSCFSPLYIVFGYENLMATIETFKCIENQKLIDLLRLQNDTFRFNATLTVLWLLLLVLSLVGVVCFIRTGEKSQKTSIKLVKAENITADYFFTYFSLFVLSFFGVDPTKEEDIWIFIFLAVLIVWVYLVNDMYFINPVLNCFGYRSFVITYKHNTSKENDICIEGRVFSRERLNECADEEFWMVFSKLDFTFCYRSPKQ